MALLSALRAAALRPHEESPAAEGAVPVPESAEKWGRAAVLCALGLATTGVLMVYSSSSVRAAMTEGDGAFYLKRQVAWAGIGLTAMVLCMRIPLSFWRGQARGLLVASVLLLGAVLVLGSEINGARRWFRMGGFSFQPSELAKLAVLVFVSAWLCDARERLADFRRGFLPAAAALGLSTVLVLKEPDFGTALFLGTLGTVLLIVGGVRMKHMLALVLLAAPVLGYEVVQRIDVIRSRFQFGGGAATDAAGYQVRQGLVALGSGGLLGRGLGAGTAKLQFLPEASSDFILPIIGEELGFAGTLLVVLLYAAFVRAGARVCLKCIERDRFAFLLALGVTLWVGLQAAINIAVVTACAPTKGIALPFVSLGGSGLVVLFAATGILYAASRRADEAAVALEGSVARTGGAAVSGPVVLFAGGGTGGHLLPGLAAAERLAALSPGATVLFAPTARDESGAWGGAALPGERLAIASPRLPRSAGEGLRFAGGFASSLWGSLRALRRRRVDGVVALGGYGCVGPSLAALAGGRPVVALEANVVPGAAVRLLARLGATAAVSFEDTVAALPRGRAVHTGNPLRASVLAGRRRDPALFGLRDDAPILAVVGGSLGARGLNLRVASSLPRLAAEGVQLLWVTGPVDAPAMEAATRAAGVRAAVLPYLKEMGALYGTADLLLARSGGGMVAEATALGVPAVYVPYPHHSDRQQALNAEALVRRGAARMVEEADLGSGAFEGVLLPLLRDAAGRERMAFAALAFGRPDAADRVARLVLERTGGAAAGATTPAPAEGRAAERAPALAGERGAHVLA